MELKKHDHLHSYKVPASFEIIITYIKGIFWYEGHFGLALIWLIITPNVEHDERKFLSPVPGPYPLPMTIVIAKKIFRTLKLISQDSWNHIGSKVDG